MSSVRKTAAGKYELAVRHPSLPKGRKYFTFDTEAAALAYDEQWQRMKAAKLVPPAELTAAPVDRRTLGGVLRAWANSAAIAPTEQPVVGLLIGEVGTVRVVEATLAWAEAWVASMKTGRIAPSTLRKRVGTLSRALNAAKLPNPCKELPRGYSTFYGGGVVRHDTVRERRLEPGEHAKIVATAGELLPLYLTIVFAGLRLKEAYTLRRGQVDLERRLLTPQTSKQWRGKVVHRSVPIRPELLPTLEVQCREKLPGALLFPFWSGEESHPQVSARLSQAFSKVFAKAGVVGLREHDLRHEACCAWLELKGKDGHWLIRPEELNRIMGWSPTSTMAARYASFRAEDLAQRVWTSQAVTQ